MSKRRSKTRYDRAIFALELRSEGKTFTEIGRRLGVCRERARCIVRWIERIKLWEKTNRKSWVDGL